MPPIKRIRGRGLPLPGDDIDTDRIVPARFLKTVTFEGLGNALFYDERFDEQGRPKDHPLNDPRYRGARFLIVNAGFGTGSSREHAPQAIKRAGFAAIVGESFAEIFFGNATQIGLVCVTAAPEDIAHLMETVQKAPETELELDLTALELRYAGRAVPVSLPSTVREAFLEGRYDPLEVLLEAMDRIRELDRTRAGPGKPGVY